MRVQYLFIRLHNAHAFTYETTATKIGDDCLLDDKRTVLYTPLFVSGVARILRFTEARGSSRPRQLIK